MVRELPGEVDVLRALAHPLRLALVEALVPGEECVCHLSHVLTQPQPYVSKHLAELASTGLVLDRREGQRVYYRLADARLAGVVESLRRLSGGLVAHERHASPGCPCPRCWVDTAAHGAAEGRV